MEPLANISHNENSTAVYFAYINSLLAGAEFEKFCNQTRCTEPVMKLQMVSPTHTHKFPHHKQTPRQSKLPALLTYEVMQCNSQRRKQNNNKKHTNFPFENLLVNMPKTRTIPQLQRNKKKQHKKMAARKQEIRCSSTIRSDAAVAIDVAGFPWTVTSGNGPRGRGGAGNFDDHRMRNIRIVSSNEKKL